MYKQDRLVTKRYNEVRDALRDSVQGNDLQGNDKTSSEIGRCCRKHPGIDSIPRCEGYVATTDEGVV